MKESLAPFEGVTAIPCPVGMDIEFQKRQFIKKYETNHKSMS